MVGRFLRKRRCGVAGSESQPYPEMLVGGAHTGGWESRHDLGGWWVVREGVGGFLGRVEKSRVGFANPFPKP